MPHLTALDLASRSRPVAKNWIKAGDKHPGRFAEKAREAGETTREYAEEKKNAGGTLGKEANFALNAMAAGKKRRAALYDHPRSRAHG